MSFVTKILFPSHKVSDRKLEEVLKNKTILISGASFGIGRLLAEKIAFPNTHIIIMGRTEDKLKEVCELVKLKGAKADYYVGDLRNQGVIEKCLKELGDREISIDIFVNNAGNSIRRSIYDSLDRFHDFTRTMSLNYYVPVNISLALIPWMTKNKGQIINISSIIVKLKPLPMWSAYQASKGAFYSWIQSVKPELLREGMFVNNICLPLVQTRMISPTKKFDKLPVMAPEAAMNLITKAMVNKDFNYKPWWTNLVKGVSRFIKLPLF